MNAESPKPTFADTFLAAPLFVKIMTILLAMAVLLGASMAWLFHVNWGEHERDEGKQRGCRLATHLAAIIDPLLRSGRLADAQKVVADVADLDPETDSVRVTDEQGRTLASSSPVVPDAPSYAVSVPLAPNSAGRVIIQMSEADIARETAMFTHRTAAAIGLVTLAAVLAVWGVTRFVTRPIEELVVRVRAAKAGDYRTPAPSRIRDEVGELSAAFGELTAALEEKRTACHGLLRKVIEVAEDERKRVARELHDNTGQALTSLIAGLAALETGPDAARAAGLRALTAQTLTEVHDLALTLRPSSLDDLGLVPALRKYCHGTARRFGVKVDCETVGLDEAERLPGEIELALYRIGQEALTNAVRHGQARSVEVMLQRKPESVLAVVQDDGRGFDATDWADRCRRDEHLGLLGIAERAGLLGGTLRVESRPGAGTSLFVEIPFLEGRPCLASAS